MGVLNRIVSTMLNSQPGPHLYTEWLALNNTGHSFLFPSKKIKHSFTATYCVVNGKTELQKCYKLWSKSTCQGIVKKKAVQK